MEPFSELFRISTFARFPASGVSERSLARAGWFYTGVGDRVQCFRCNVTAEGWLAGDCPAEKHRQLSPSCSFVQSLKHRPDSVARLYTLFFFLKKFCLFFLAEENIHFSCQICFLFVQEQDH
uniref:Baculoviral IAP repeat containing 2 n=1 Tax=Hippocampus comes TaxID=109280 RepID=A0A3Q2XK63_HIPCM